MAKSQVKFLARKDSEHFVALILFQPKAVVMNKKQYRLTIQVKGHASGIYLTAEDDDPQALMAQASQALIDAEATFTTEQTTLKAQFEADGWEFVPTKE